MHYDNASDANLYLRDTLVKYKKELVTVAGVDNDMMTSVYDSKGSVRHIHISELDLTPIKLGYIFHVQENKAYYVERKPQRQWRQGLTAGACSIKNRTQNMYLDFHAAGVISKQLAKDRYPTIHRAFRIAKLKRTEVPFTHSFSVDYAGLVRYKTLAIGTWNRSSISLMDNFSYLKDTIEDYMNEHYRHL